MSTAKLVAFAQSNLASVADSEKAVKMAAYMKTDMPFYGVSKPTLAVIIKTMRKQFVPDSRASYEAMVLALWNLPHREEKYLALAVAHRHKKLISTDSLPLYERLLREGAWWDLVDEIISKLISPLLRDHRAHMRPVMDAWIDDTDSMWIRRAAILSQLKHKAQTDTEQLFGYCLRRAHEKEFFIRKAIGWALRDYSYAGPEEVRQFLLDHQSELSGLSFREGKKRLVRVGIMA